MAAVTSYSWKWDTSPWVEPATFMPFAGDRCSRTCGCLTVQTRPGCSMRADGYREPGWTQQRDTGTRQRRQDWWCYLTTQQLWIYIRLKYTPLYMRNRSSTYMTTQGNTDLPSSIAQGFFITFHYFVSYCLFKGYHQSLGFSLCHSHHPHPPLNIYIRGLQTFFDSAPDQ